MVLLPRGSSQPAKHCTPITSLTEGACSGLNTPLDSMAHHAACRQHPCMGVGIHAWRAAGTACGRWRHGSVCNAQAAPNEASRVRTTNLQLRIPKQVPRDGLARPPVYDLQADPCAALGPQDVPCQVLASKCGCAAPVWCLPAELAVHVQAPQAPAGQHLQRSRQLHDTHQIELVTGAKHEGEPMTDSVACRISRY